MLTNKFILTTYPGYGCQIDCEYCDFPKDKNKTMDFKIYLRVFELLKKTKYKNILIAFHGGEPLIHYKNIYKFIQLCKSIINKKIDFSIVTNGILLDKNKIVFLNKQNLNLRLSLDGDFQTHIKNRTNNNINEEQYYLKLKQNLQLISLYFDPNRFLINMVVAPNTVKNLANNIIYLKDLGVKRIFMNYASGLIWSKSAIDRFKINLNKIEKMNLDIFKYSKIDLLHFMISGQCVISKIDDLKNEINKNIKFLYLDYNGDIFSEEAFSDQRKQNYFLANIYKIKDFDNINCISKNIEILQNQNINSKKKKDSEIKLSRIMLDFVKNNLKK